MGLAAVTYGELERVSDGGGTQDCLLHHCLLTHKWFPDHAESSIIAAVMSNLVEWVLKM